MAQPGHVHQLRESRQVDYVLSLMGFAVGLGNLWRFPYLCFKNGGGAFFVPYLLFMFTCGAPLFFLESSLGQFTQQGVLKCWNIVPIFKGVGISTMFALLYLNIYYVVILAWILFYMLESFKDPLPFSTCGNSWNSDKCHTVQQIRNSFSPNITLSVDEYWNNHVLQRDQSSGIDDPGFLNWQLALSLFIVWVGCYFAVFRGIKISGKIVYFTVLFPYVLIFCFILRGLTLEGSLQGIVFYLKPNMDKLKEAQVWIDAASQIFFSYAVCCGGLITLSSHNHYSNNVLRDSMIVIVANPCTSILSGFAVFSVLGHLSHEAGVPIEAITDSGPGLIFKMYPVAVSLLPLPNVWSVLFFFMVFLLGVDGQYAAVESFVCSLLDVFPQFRKTSSRQAMFTLAVCLAKFIVGLTMVSKGGIFVFNLWDCYGASGLIFLSIGLCQITPLMYCYGFSRYKRDIEQMVGFKSILICWFNFCWTFLSPVIISAILVFAIYQKMTSPSEFKYADYVYPVWAQLIGWMFIFTALIWIPLYAIYHLVTTRLLPTSGSRATPDDADGQESRDLKVDSTNC
ncbi:sodium- and chloride-dependent GABA transporter 2-like isoform X2 [Symsagittifera roscoffensis]|uniref:sodium- and chloride-dependent GABA transporter 2-like isoform X2 n=1 Tax=Symsagittifera roscoffensis TaxID=84072 RepID=UPI00307C4E21